MEATMNNQREFSHLKFERQLARLSPRLMVVLTTLIIYLLLWWILPSSALLVILLFILPILAWVCSFGWQTALGQVIRYLQRLQIH
jgi:mannose/fructose/N-acetylgalactosamine-specific phosphotransferase system component IID